MWTMIQYEFKKLFHSPLSILPLCFILLLPFVYGWFNFHIGTDMSIDGVNYNGMVRVDNQNYTGWEAYQKENKLYASLSGVMDEAWFDQKLNALHTLQDQNQEVTTEQILLMDIPQIRPFTSGAMWEDDADYMKLFGYEPPKEERTFPAFVKSEMNKVDHFTYGSYKNWKFLANCISGFGMMFAVYIAIIGSTIYNNEHSHHMMEEIKTGDIGKYKAGGAKMIVILTLTTVVPLIAVALYTLVTKLIFGLENGDVTLAVFHQITPYTFQDMVQLGSILLIVGSIGIASLAMALSNALKSSYTSCAIMVVFCIMPLFTFVQVQGVFLSQLFPTFFVNLENVFVNFPFLTMGSHTMYYKDFIIVVWGILSVLCLGYVMWKYRRYERT